MKIILLTTDGFDLARRTAQWAVTHAKERGTQIAVFFSMPQCARDDGGDGRLIDPMLAVNHASTVKKRARRHLREIDRKCAQAGVACSAIDAAIELACASDEPHEAIINAADKSGRDLIFMAVHGLGGLSARLVGSLAQKVWRPAAGLRSGLQATTARYLTPERRLRHCATPRIKTRHLSAAPQRGVGITSPWVVTFVARLETKAKVVAMNILVIAEHDNASIRGATRHTVIAAAQIVMFTDAQVHLMVMGHQAEQAAQEGAHIAGVAQVIHVDGAQFAHDWAGHTAAQIRAIASNYCHILFAATAWGRLIASSLAVEFGVTLINDIVSIESADMFEHAIEAGRETATVQSTDAIKVLTVRTSRFEAAPATGGSAAVECMAAVAPGRQPTMVDSEIAKKDGSEHTADRGPRALQTTTRSFMATGICGAIGQRAGMRHAWATEDINRDQWSVPARWPANVPK